MNADGKFPIQAKRNTGEPVRIPWAHAEEAYREYSARYGTKQSLQHLSDRGGFGAEEIISLLVQRIQRIIPST